MVFSRGKTRPRRRIRHHRKRQPFDRGEHRTRRHHRQAVRQSIRRPCAASGLSAVRPFDRAPPVSGQGFAATIGKPRRIPASRGDRVPRPASDSPPPSASLSGKPSAVRPWRTSNTPRRKRPRRIPANVRRFSPPCAQPLAVRLAIAATVRFSPAYFTPKTPLQAVRAACLSGKPSRRKRTPPPSEAGNRSTVPEVCRRIPASRPRLSAIRRTSKRRHHRKRATVRPWRTSNAPRNRSRRKRPCKPWRPCAACQSATIDRAAGSVRPVSDSGQCQRTPRRLLGVNQIPPHFSFTLAALLHLPRPSPVCNVRAACQV